VVYDGKALQTTGEFQYSGALESDARGRRPKKSIATAATDSNMQTVLFDED
jgi:hypothetical protein